MAPFFQNITYHFRQIFCGYKLSRFQRAVNFTDDQPSLISSVADVYKRQTLVILTGKSRYLEEDDYPNLCILQETVSAVSVLSFLQEIFLKYEEWNQGLFDLILNQPSVQKLIDLSTSVIPNPMTVIGLDFTVIATGNQPDNQLKDGIFGSTEETQNVVNSLKQDSNYEEAQYLSLIHILQGFHPLSHHKILAHKHHISCLSIGKNMISYIISISILKAS